MEHFLGLLEVAPILVALASSIKDVGGLKGLKVVDTFSGRAKDGAYHPAPG